MSTDFKDLLYLFACGVHDIQPQCDGEINLENIYKMACKQEIWGTVFLSVKKLIKAGALSVNPATLAAWERSFFLRAGNQIKKRTVINDVLKALSDASIPAYLLKGDIISRYYAEPLSRVSSDTDIYVGEEYLARAEKVFESCGFNVHARSPMEHHTVCDHPAGGSVDLHLTFHDDSFEENFFKGYTEITEEPVFFSVDGFDCPSLGYTDNAIFLFLHMTKHFLSCGTGIRQIMDFLLFFRENRSHIDIAMFKKMLEELKFTELFAACVYIGCEYLMFDNDVFSDFEISPDEFFVNWLMMDIEQGGVFGKLEQRKLTFYYLFGDEAVSTKKTGKYIKVYSKTFGYQFLSKKYAYLRKCKLLLPIAWLNRIFDILRSALRVAGTVRKTNIENDELANIKNRMTIIEKIHK